MRHTAKIMSLPARGEWIEIGVSLYHPKGVESLPARGEWIEIEFAVNIHIVENCLSPHGESGLKFTDKTGGRRFYPSLPARGEWIEIQSALPEPTRRKSLSPHGESGLKLRIYLQAVNLS